MLALTGGSLVSAIILLIGLAKYRQTGTVGNSGAETTGSNGLTPTPHQIPYGPEYTSGPAASPSPAALAARIAPRTGYPA